MISSSVSASSSRTDSYTDLSSLNTIRNLGRKDKNEALGEIAKQFESMMVRMMMKSMRSANEVFAEGNMLSSNESDMYQDMFDDQLALSLSQGRGMGIAEVMVRQLQDRFGVAEGTSDKKYLSDYKNTKNQSAGDITGLVSARAAVATIERTSQEKTSSSKNIEFDGSSEQFVGQLYSMAKDAADKLGVDPEVLIAQAALETGWGEKITGLGDKTSFNFFNIKADNRWQGSSVSVPTLEVRNGTAVREVASFRAYDSPQQSFDDYADFISNSPRYEKAIESKNSEEYIQALGDAGYATDPKYSEKIINILNSQKIQQVVANYSLATGEG